MSLNYLLLGITRDGASGYEVKRAFEEGLQHIWDAELSQIYPALQRLEDRGLLASSRKPGERGSDKRIYKPTAKGSRELHQWLRSDPILHDERHPFLVQLCLLGDLEDYSETLKYFTSLEAVMRARVQAMEFMEEKWRTHDPLYPEVAAARDFHVQLTLEFGLANARAGLRCCQHCIARIKRRISTKAVQKGKDGKGKQAS
jgi:DNA-binding PadR family transcriptional regulator